MNTPTDSVREELRHENGIPRGSVHVESVHPLPLTEDGKVPASIIIVSKKGLEWAQYVSVEECTRREAAARDAVDKRVGFLRQWLNEDRITDPNKMVTSEQILHWLELATLTEGKEV